MTGFRIKQRSDQVQWRRKRYNQHTNHALVKVDVENLRAVLNLLLRYRQRILCKWATRLWHSIRGIWGRLVTRLGILLFCGGGLCRDPDKIPSQRMIEGRRSRGGFRKYTWYLSSLMSRRNCREPATLQRSPILTNKVFRPIVTRSRPSQGRFTQWRQNGPKWFEASCHRWGAILPMEFRPNPSGDRENNK